MQRIGRGRRARGTCRLSRDELTVQSEWYKARMRLALGYGLAGASRRKANHADLQRCASQRSRRSRSNQAARSCAAWPRSRQRRRTRPQACGACSSGSRGAGAAGLVRAVTDVQTYSPLIQASCAPPGCNRPQRNHGLSAAEITTHFHRSWPGSIPHSRKSGLDWLDARAQSRAPWRVGTSPRIQRRHSIVYTLRRTDGRRPGT